MANNYDEDLDALDDMHDPKKVPSFGGNVPDGTYQARLDTIFLSRKDEKLKTIMTFEIVGGEHKFRKQAKFCQMETAENLNFLTNDLRKLGAPRNFKWNTLEKEIFPAVLDAFVEITVKTKGNFTNVYINKTINPITQQTEDKDVPF